MRDKVSANPLEINVASTFELIELIPKLRLDICINSHPQRWHDSFFAWTGELVFQNIKNLGKRYFLNK